MINRLSNQSGFTLIELMIVIAIVGILAATAGPWFKDYTARSKMTEVINFAKEAKTPVAECILAKYSVGDCNNNQVVGLGAAANITSQYVESLTVGANGVVTVAIQGSNVAPLDAASLQMIPTYNANSGIAWQCQISDATLNKYMPKSCRQ